MASLQDNAVKVYKKLTETLDARDWHYDRVDDKLMIKSGVKSDDLPIEFFMVVNAEKQVIQFLSTLPCTIPENKRVDAAIAVCVANFGLCNGSFDYNISDGMIAFRLTTSFINTELSPDLLETMIMIGASTVDSYNDKFFMLAKGMMTVQQFIEGENSEE